MAAALLLLLLLHGRGVTGHLEAADALFPAEEEMELKSQSEQRAAGCWQGGLRAREIFSK